MSLVQPYIDNLEKIKNNLGDVARQALLDNLDFILYLIKERQLDRGLNAGGNVVGKYKTITEAYADDDREASGGVYPRKDKEPNTPYNFDWFGSFKDGIYVKLNNDEGFDILTRDGKVGILELQYGKLLKLTEEHNDQVNNQVIFPALGKYISENIFV